jgi:hypothetical protein
MKTTIQLAIVGIILLTGCKKNEHGAARAYEPIYPNTPVNSSTVTYSRSNPNGQGGVELVYYDSVLVKMNLMELSEQAAEKILANNKAINLLYEAEDFVTVIDAIQGDDYNPVWREVEIEFNAGFAPHQFYSDDEVLAAAAGTNPEITLEPTDEIYRCAVIQHTKAQ